jgi:hypothetical protein
MPFEPDPRFFCGTIRDDSVVIVNSRSMEDSRCGTIRDDSVVVTNSSNMEGARSGVIRDDDCSTYWFEGHGCLPGRS